MCAQEEKSAPGRECLASLAQGNQLHLQIKRQLTWNVNIHQGKELEDENGDPAEGVGEHNEEEPLDDGHLHGEDAALSRPGGSDMDGIEHACVGKHDEDKGHQVQTCQWERGKNRLDVAKSSSEGRVFSHLNSW